MKRVIGYKEFPHRGGIKGGVLVFVMVFLAVFVLIPHSAFRIPHSDAAPYVTGLPGGDMSEIYHNGIIKFKADDTGTTIYGNGNSGASVFVGADGGITLYGITDFSNTIRSLLSGTPAHPNIVNTKAAIVRP